MNYLVKRKQNKFLVVELVYKNKKQPFAVPILTNIKRDYNKLFWFQLPSRLETDVGKRRGYFLIR